MKRFTQMLTHPTSTLMKCSNPLLVQIELDYIRIIIRISIITHPYKIRFELDS